MTIFFKYLLSNREINCIIITDLVLRICKKDCSFSPLFLHPLLGKQSNKIGGIHMLNKIRKNLKDKVGFTLVELIVVLVILAILAAMLVPALTGYIDKANKEKVTAECRQVVMAAQTEVSSL